MTARRSRSWRAPAIAVALASMLVPAVARADAASDAKALFVRGRALRTADDCAGAVSVFRQAYLLYPSALGPLRNIAECDEALGDRAGARQAWLDLGRALEAHPEAKYAGWSDDAAKAAARLAPPANAATPAAPGTTDAQADAHGAPLLATSEVPAADPPSDKATATRRAVAWAAIGVGAASLVGAGIGLLVRQSALDDLDSICPVKDASGNFVRSLCTRDPDSDEGRGSAATTVADVLGVVGVLGVASGLVLLLTTPASTKHVAVGVSPGGIWAAGRF
jgi:hypothetical protein